MRLHGHRNEEDDLDVQADLTNTVQGSRASRLDSQNVSEGPPVPRRASSFSPMRSAQHQFNLPQRKATSSTRLPQLAKSSSALNVLKAEVLEESPVVNDHRVRLAVVLLSSNVSSWNVWVNRHAYVPTGELKV